METKKEKQLIEQRRQDQDHEHTLLRQKELEEALRREHQLADSMRQQYKNNLRLFKKCYDDINHHRQLERHQKHVTMCRSIAEQIAALATRVNLKLKSKLVYHG